MNVPVPPQPDVMLFIIHVPDTVFALVIDPCSVSTVFPIVAAAFELWMVIPNEFILPFGMTDPVAEAPVGKHAIPIVNCIFVAVTM